MKLFKVLSILVIAMLMVTAIAKPVSAWNCVNYNFRVLEDGTVQAQNMSTANEPAQTAKVYIDGVLVTSVSAPALAAGTDWTTIGSVTVPEVAYTWQVQGDSDCGNSGSYTPPTYCEATTQDAAVWNGWVVAGDGLSRTRTGTIAIWDAADPTHSCGSEPVSETEYLYCLEDGSTSGWYPEGQAPGGATKGECVPPTEMCPVPGLEYLEIDDPKCDTPEQPKYVDICYQGKTLLHISEDTLGNYTDYKLNSCPAVAPVTGGEIPNPFQLFFLRISSWFANLFATWRFN